MKDKIPHCPNCKTSNYVVLDKRSTQVSTAIGGMAGAGTGYAGVVSKVPKGIPTDFGSLAIALAGLVLALFMGFLTGAATGSAVGEHIDSKMRITFRCNQCGKKFKG